MNLGISHLGREAPCGAKRKQFASAPSV